MFHRTSCDQRQHQEPLCGRAGGGACDGNEVTDNVNSTDDDQTTDRNGPTNSPALSIYVQSRVEFGNLLNNLFTL